MSLIKPEDIAKKKKMIEEASKDLAPHLRKETTKKLIRNSESCE